VALATVGATLWALTIEGAIDPAANVVISMAVGALLATWATRSALEDLEVSHAVVVAGVTMLLLIGVRHYNLGTPFGAESAIQMAAGVGGAVGGALLARVRLPRARVPVAGMIAGVLIPSLVIGVHWVIPGFRAFYAICGGAFLSGAVTAALVPGSAEEEIGAGQCAWIASVTIAWFARHWDAGSFAGEAIRAVGAVWIGLTGAKLTIGALERRRAATPIPEARAREGAEPPADARQ
jgi:hypothetical protein